MLSRLAFRTLLRHYVAFPLREVPTATHGLNCAVGQQIMTKQLANAVPREGPHYGDANSNG